MEHYSFISQIWLYGYLFVSLLTIARHGNYWKKLQLFCIDIFTWSNLTTVPNSASSDSPRGSGRCANRSPAAVAGQTSVKARLELDCISVEPNLKPISPRYVTEHPRWLTGSDPWAQTALDLQQWSVLYRSYYLFYCFQIKHVCSTWISTPNHKHCCAEITHLGNH